jgi:hypothetical protein
MPTAVNGQLYYSQDEVQAGLPQYHAALRQATGYTGQFSADPTQKFQQYITGATSEQQAAARRLADIYGSGSFAPGTKPKVVPPNPERRAGYRPGPTPIWREPVRPTGASRISAGSPRSGRSGMPCRCRSEARAPATAIGARTKTKTDGLRSRPVTAVISAAATSAPGQARTASTSPPWNNSGISRPVVPGPYADPSGGDRNWGANQDKNQWIAQQTGYGGDFGGGNFSAWASQNGVDVAALEQQWSKQQPVVPVPYEDPSGLGIGQLDDRSSGSYDRSAEYPDRYYWPRDRSARSYDRSAEYPDRYYWPRDRSARSYDRSAEFTNRSARYPRWSTGTWCWSRRNSRGNRCSRRRSAANLILRSSRSYGRSTGSRSAANRRYSGYYWCRRWC